MKLLLLIPLLSSLLLEISIKKPQPSYRKSDIIIMSVKNTRIDTCEFYIGLEKLLNDRWAEIAVDIYSKPISRKALLHFIPPQDSISLVCKLKNIDLGALGKAGEEYRFVTTYSRRYSAAEEKFYSSSFIIKH
ncbi:MAG: hypothetical protein KA149_10860 [Chitinophagales bacterium]|nr:hypothetical protein [Chitinophagales bacterium]